MGNDIARIRSDTTNGPTVETKGIDADINYHFDDILDGGVYVGANVSYVLAYKQAAFSYGGVAVSAAYDAVGFTNYDRLPGTIPKWRGQFYADYNRGNHNLRWTINYVDGATDNRGPTTVQTGASSNCNVANAKTGTATNCQLTTLGLELGAFVSHDLTYRLLLPNDMTLTASVLNALDEEPAKARIEYSYDPFIGNPLGRTFKLGLKKKF